MRRLRLLALVVLPLVVAAGAVLWAAGEARSQRREVERALASQATLLAGTLGPALASAAASSRELDELLAARLLDNARLLARLESEAAPAGEELEELLVAHDLTAVLVIDEAGRIVRAAGVDAGLEPALAQAAAPLLGGPGEELVAASPAGERPPWRAAAARTAGGGAVVVAADPGSAFAFSRQLGVVGLLRGLAATEAVLYLVYREDGFRRAASWDGGPAPAPGAERVRGRPVFEVTVPVASPAGTEASLRVGLDGHPLAAAAGSAIRRTALVGAVLAAFGLASAGLTLAQLARARERAASERRLAELEEERRGAERLAAAGALAAGLAHQVRNPLNAIGIAAQRIRRAASGGSGAVGSGPPDSNPPEPAARAASASDLAGSVPSTASTGALAAQIGSEVARLDTVLAGFLGLAGPAAGERREHDVAALARDAAALARLEADAHGVGVEARGGPAPARVDGEAVRGAVLNLVRNAVEASPRGSLVEVEVGRNGRGEALRVRVVVRDRGSGIAAAIAGREFDPFVTGRADGTGLGLAVVRRVVEEHGGRAHLGPRPGGGVEAVLELPAGGGR
jgi:signal transduction histidine kinase